MKLIYSFLLFSYLVLNLSCKNKNSHPRDMLIGKVIGIVDGDTIDFLTEDKNVIRIRLAAIDAPEKKQPFGKKAKEFISTLCFSKQIKVKKTGEDRNKRVIAFCYLEDGTNINYSMVENGYAWHFVKYSKDENLAGIEEKAKAQRVGLWSDNAPIEPWEWRKGRRR